MQGIRHHTIIYQLKPGTSTSYYFSGGDAGLLPERICITRDEFAPVNAMLKPKAGQIKATFKRREQSVYKTGEGTIHSTIYALIMPKPSIIGTGDLKGTNVLLVFQSGNEWQEIILHLFTNGKFYEKECINEILKRPLP